MKVYRHAACGVLAVALLLVSPAYATSFSTDQSDLYYIPAESGWGIQLVQRGPVIFATLFVYGATGEPTWYTATLDYTSTFTWTGQLIATSGTYFKSPWNPKALTINVVGEMTWQAQTVDTGVLTYVVNGVTVTKNITRQTLVLDDFSGVFAGALQEIVTGCPQATQNGTFPLAVGFEITQTGAAIALKTATQSLQSTSGAPITCSYAGTLSESGQMAAVPEAAFSCSDGSLGTISLEEMQVTEHAISGHFTASYSNPPGCQSSGGFGAGRITTF
jgi:hypothetical protein